ncbi:MAG: LamG-like jellyroll fold domain-containing protein, partial [Acidimicrobiales bacterium]
THLAVTWEGTTLRLYVNGTEVASKARAGTGFPTGTAPVRLGGNMFGENFFGRIDDARIYNRALSPTEIVTDMNTPVGPVQTDTTPPTAPTALSGTATSPATIALSWGAATDNIGVIGYQIERSTDGGTTFTLVATVGGTSHTDSGLTPSTSYTYRVRAVDAVPNFGPYSNIVTATTAPPDTTPPTAPTTLAATPGIPGTIALSWGAATDNVGVAGYQIERSTGGGPFTLVATIPGTSYNNTGLTPSTSYTYRVRAFDTAPVPNFGPYSNVATATTSAAVVGPIAAYGFDEGSGTTASDFSGFGNVGALTNGPTWTPDGKTGSALSFDGVNDQVVIPAASSLNLSNAMTLEAWVYPTGPQSGWRTIIQRDEAAYFLHASSPGNPLQPTGGGTFDGTQAQAVAPAPSALPLNTWSHLALTWEGTTLRVYVNGVEVASMPRGGTLQSVTTPVRIGGNSFGDMFLGRIDDVRIYNRALSPT